MAGEVHSIYAINIGATLLGGITDVNASSGIEAGGKIANGQLYRYFNYVKSMKPQVGFKTLHALDALGLVPLTGLSLASSALKFFGQQKDCGGARPSTFVSFLASYGLLYPKRLSCSTNEDAEAEFEALLTSDLTGANDPLVFGSDTPSGTFDVNADNKRYTLGTTSAAGVTLQNVTRVDVDFGITANVLKANSDVIAKRAWIDTIMPKITIDVEDISLLGASSFPLWSGTAVTAKHATHANTSIQLRKRQLGGAPYASSGHLTLTTDGLCYVSVIAKGTDQGNMAGQIVIESINDGTNAPLKWS